jgi:hypothetical protein
MMALNCLAASSKLKRTVGWTILILGSLWLLAACASGGGYGAPGGQNISPPVPGGYCATGNELHGEHSDYYPDLP